MRGAVWARRTAEGAWLLLLVVLPAAFNPYGMFVFDPLKAALLRCLGVVIAIAWLGSRLLGHGPRVEVGRHPLVRAGLAVLVALGISTAVSVDPQRSFFGSDLREMGWLTLAAAGVLLVTAADLFAAERPRERAITALLLGAVVPCVYALLQRVGRDPFPFSDLGGGPSSTFGSPTFLGGYLVLVAPFALYRLVVAGQALRDDSGNLASLRYAVHLVLLLLVGAVTALTTIRGPLLGLLAGGLTFVALACLKAPARWRRFGWLGGALFLVVVLLLSVAVAGGAGGLRVLSRFTDQGRPLISATDRLVLWRGALPLPLSQPLRAVVGFGPETQSIPLEQLEESVRRSPNEQWDRVHNILLDTWLTGGALSLGLLLLVLGLTVQTCWQVFRAASGSRALLAAALLAACVAHIAEAVFAFETVVTAAWFWAVVGLAASLQPRCTAGRPTVVRRPARLVWGASAAAGLLLLPYLALPAFGDEAAGWSTRAESANANREAALRAEAAADWVPWQTDLPQIAGVNWQRLGLRQTDATTSDTLLARAEQDLREAANRNPHDAFAQLRLALHYAAWAQHHPQPPPEMLEEAERACARAMALGPFRWRVWFDCAGVSALRGQAQQAIDREVRGRLLMTPVS